MTEDMVKKKYMTPFIKVKEIKYHVMDAPGIGISSEEDDDSRQSKESSSSFIDYSFDEEEDQGFSF